MPTARRPRAVLVLLIVALATLMAGAAPETACGQRLTGAPAQGAVLCCCDTAFGECCKWVSICSRFIPGCMCAPGAYPGE